MPYETLRGSIVLIGWLAVAILFLPLVPAVFAQSLADDDVQIQGNFLEWYFAKDNGGILSSLHITGGTTNLAGEEGLAQEGFGVGSHYVPNRRLNEKLEMLEQASAKPMLRYQYDCDGPNIQGLHVTRLMEPLPDECSMRITWTIENKGKESQWISPWVKNDVRPVNPIRIDLPTLNGVIVPQREAYYPASRNWAAMTNTQTGDTVYTVSHADHTHAFLALQNDGARRRACRPPVPRILYAQRALDDHLPAERGARLRGFRDRRVGHAIGCEGRPAGGTVFLREGHGKRPYRGQNVAENKRVWRMPEAFRRGARTPGALHL